LIAPLIVVDAAIDVTSPAPGCSVVTLARALLLEGGPEVHCLLVVLVDLGLELTELLE
jgi:DNA-binding phage protein